MSHTIIVLARINLVSLYVRLLWYHSILRGSIDQKHAKTNEIWRQNSEIHSVFTCSRWPLWFPDPQTVRRMREAWKRETFLRSQSFLSESAVKYLHVGRRKIQISPPLGEQDQWNKGPTKTIKSPPHALPPRRHDIDRCITPTTVYVP